MMFSIMRGSWNERSAVVFIGWTTLFVMTVLENEQALAEDSPRTMIRSVPVENAPSWDCLDADSPFVFWRAKVGSGAASPVIASGRILLGTNNADPRNPTDVGDRGVMMCFNLDDGKFLWQSTHARTGDLHRDLPFQPIKSRPAVLNRRVYYVSNRAELVCLDLDGFRDNENDGPYRDENRTGPMDADILWRFDMEAELGVRKRDSTDAGNPLSSPLVVGNLVYCVTGNGRFFGEIPNPDAPSFVAVDKATGRLVWTSNGPGKNIILGQWSSPVLAQVGDVRETVFPGGDGALYGCDPLTGELHWKLDLGRRDHPLGKPRFFVADPIFNNGVIYVGLNRTFEARQVASRPVYAIELNVSGKTLQPRVKWEFDSNDFDGGTFGSVVNDRNNAYAVSRSGIVYGLDLVSGKELWRSDLGNHTAFFASPYVHAGRLYVASVSDLFVFSVSGKMAKCLGRYRFGNGLLSSTPVVSNDRLYMPAGGYLWALRLIADS